MPFNVYIQHLQYITQLNHGGIFKQLETKPTNDISVNINLKFTAPVTRNIYYIIDQSISSTTYSSHSTHKDTFRSGKYVEPNTIAADGNKRHEGISI